MVHHKPMDKANLMFKDPYWRCRPDKPCKVEYQPPPRHRDPRSQTWSHSPPVGHSSGGASAYSGAWGGQGAEALRCSCAATPRTSPASVGATRVRTASPFHKTPWRAGSAGSRGTLKNGDPSLARTAPSPAFSTGGPEVWRAATGAAVCAVGDAGRIAHAVSGPRQLLSTSRSTLPPTLIVYTLPVLPLMHPPPIPKVVMPFGVSLLKNGSPCGLRRMRLFTT